ncbi:MAG: hypothetical protein ACLRX9_02490 [Streptococcus salivarius]
MTITLLLSKMVGTTKGLNQILWTHGLRSIKEWDRHGASNPSKDGQRR